MCVIRFTRSKYELTQLLDDDSKGYFVQSTVIVAKEAKQALMSTDILGPILTVWPYPATLSWKDILSIVNSTGAFGLTGSM